MESQSQKDYRLAIELVDKVARDYPTGDDTRRRYGALCHDFPIMLRNAGLAQTVAFYRAKAAGNGGRVFALVLEHAATILGQANGVSGLESRVLGSTMRAYREDSARLWGAWVYFKRLAVSILKVEAGTDTDAPDIETETEHV